MAYPFGKSDFEISTPVNARPARRSYGAAIREIFARRRERKQTSQRRHAVTVEAMEPRILLSADPIFAHVLADGGDYTLGLMFDDTADLYRIQLTNDIDGLVVASSELDGVNEVQITGTSDADRLTVDLLFRPDPAFKVTFDGGDGADELIIDGPKHTNVTYDLGANGTGTITQSEGGTDHVRDFLNVELVTDASAADSRIINDTVSGRGGSIIIGDNDVENDGLSRISMGPDGSKTVLDFAKPALGGVYGSGALDINIMDGNDDIRFEGFDQQLTDAATELDLAGNPDVVARLIAGGNAELTGPQADVTWYIIGQDRAYVDGLFVSGVDTLTGADNNDDTFYFELNLGNTFADGGVNDPWETIDLPGRWSGDINGGVGGTDIIVQQGAVFSGPMAGSTGSATINLQTFNYSGMEPTVTVGGSVGDDDFTLQATGTGAFEIIDGSGARFGGFTFNAGAPLVVNLGFGDDTFRLGAGLTAWSGSLTVRGDFGGDVIYMENNLNTRGGDIEMDAELIVVDGAVIDTRLLAGSVGSHGDILLEGGGSGVASSRFAGIFSGDNPFENGGAEVEGAGIVIGGGAQLLAADVKGNSQAATAGSVTITVDAGFALDALAFTPGLNEKIAAAAIQIGNAVIRAGELKISATADSSKAVEIEIDVDALLGLPDDGSAEGEVEDGEVPLLVGGIQLAASELENAIQQQFDNLPVLGALTNKIPVHFMRAEAIAKIDLLDGLDVWAETSIDIDANATSELTFTNPGMNFGFTFGESDATALTTVEGVVTLESGGLVSIGATAENTLDVATNIQSGLVFKAKKSSSAGSNQKRVKGPAIAVTLGDATTTATTDIGSGAVIIADDVTISADTTTKQSVGTSSKIVQPQSNQGTAIGITVAFLDNQATAQVAGDLTATDTVTVEANAVNEETLLSTKASTKAKPAAADQGAAGAAKQQITGKTSGLAGKWGGPGNFGLSAGVIVSENTLGANALVLDGAVIEAETLNLTARVEDNFRTTAIGGSGAGAAVSLAGAVNVSQFDNDAIVRIDAATVTVGALVMSAEAIIPNQVDLLDEIPALGAAFSDLATSLGDMPSLSDAFSSVWGSVDVQDPAATRGALADAQTAFTDYYDESLGPALTGVNDSITPFLGYLTPTGGLPNKIATSYVAASAAAGGGGPNGPEGKFALNGSVNIMLIENKASAGIGAGALVTVTGDDGATIESNATVETVDIVGIPNIKALFKGSTKSDGSAMGGAFSYVSKLNEADSYVADGATVTVTKDLMVDAVTRQFVFNVTDAGGSGDDLNFQGSISINDHENNARAWIEDGAKVSADNVTVNADHSATMLSFGLSLAKGGSTGIGISSAVNIANNVTLAKIGDVVSDTIPFGFEAGVTAAGDVNVTADSTNLGLTVAFAGAKPDSGGAAPDPADNAPAAAPTPGDVTVNENTVDVGGKAGLGISGAIGINIINQHTEATIADTDVAVGGDLLVHAMTQAPVVSVSMPVTLITGSSGSGSNTGIAGGLSVTKFDRDTIAQIVSGTVTMTGNGDVTVEAETRSETVAVVVGGSGGSQSDTAIAGSVNVTIADDDTFAAIGAGASVLNAKDVAVTAHDNAISVTVAGAAADGNKTGVGAAFDIGIYNDTVEARIDGTVTSSSDVTVAASNFSVLVSVAASLGSADTGLGLAGSVGVNYVDSDVTAEIGGTVTANGSVGVFATDQLIAVSIVGAVGKGTTGIGIAPGVMVVDHDTRAALTSTANVTARGFGAGLNYFGGTGYGLTVAADTDDKLFMVAIAGAKGDTTALAGSVGSINVLGTTEATIANNARVNDDGNASTIAAGGSSAQDVTVAAQAGALQITATGGAAKGGSTAIGAAFGITTMDRDVIASVGTGAFIEARRDLLVHADSRDTIITFAVGGSQSDSFSGAGSLSLGVLDRTTTAYIDGTVRVGGNVSVSSDARLNAAMIAGSIAISSSAGAVGISAAPLITINNTSAEIRGNADIAADAGNTTVVSTLEGDRSIRGVDVAANDRIVSVAAAISGSTSSGGFQGAGAFSGAFLFGTEQVIDGSNPVPSLDYENPSATGNASVTQALVVDGARVTTSGNLSLSADTAATVVAITGAVAAGGGSSGVGLSGTVVARKNITQAVIGAAEIHADALVSSSALADDGDTRSINGVDVSADSDLVIVALTVGGAGSSGFSGAGAITVVVTDDVTRASILSGADITTGGNLTIGSDSDLILTFGSGAVAIGSSGGIGASVAVAVTLSKTVAEIAEGATVSAMANGAASNIPYDEGTRAVRGVDLYADSFFVVAGLTVAGSGGSGIAGSGTINVVVQTDETRASIGALEPRDSGDPAFAATSVTTENGNITLEADSDAIIVPLSGAIAGGSGPAFGATIVTLTRIAETTALIGGGAMINAGATNATVITDSGAARTIRGVDLVATSSPVLVAAGVAGAVGGGGAAAGVIAVVTSDEDVTAMVRDATLSTDGNVTLFADTARGRDGISDQDLRGAIIEPVTSAVIVAGGGAIGGGSGVGVGATIGTVIVTHDVSAKITNSTVTANAQRGATDRAITALPTRTATGVDVVAQSDMFAAALTVAGGASDSVGVAGAFSNVTAIRTTDAQINASTITTNGNATVLADSDATLEALAGGIGVAGAVGVGVGAAVTFHSDTTEASVQGDGTLIARGNTAGTFMPTGSELGGAKVLDNARGLAVSAVSEQTIITGAVGAGVSGNAGVAATAAISVQEEYTRAWIGAGTTVSDAGANSTQDATVLARDINTVVTTGGSVGIGANGGGAGGAGVQVTTKETQAWIAGSVTVNDDIIIRALSADEAVVVSISGAGGLYAGLAGSASVATINNTTEATVRATARLDAGDSIAVNALDETSLDVVAGAIAAALGAGGASGGVTVVDKSTKTEVQGGAVLISGGAGAGVKTLTGGVGITFAANGSGDNDVNLSEVGDIDLSEANAQGFVDGGATGERVASLTTATQGGIHIQAVSTDRVETISFNLAAGGAAVALGGTANVFLNETKSLVGTGARLTTTDAGDDISVGAASDAYALNVMAAVGVGGTAGAPGASAAVFDNSTEARMTGAFVRSAGDFTLTASGTDDALAVTIALAGGGGVGIGASANAIVVTSDVTAAIDGASDIMAAYNVAVAANHTTDIDVIGGAVGVGGSGAGGAAVNVIVIEKTTDASIGGSSVVVANALGSANMTVADGGLIGTNDTYDDGDRASTVAIKGAAITATSAEDIFVIGAAGAVSGFAGAAGAVSVIVVDSDTSAYLGNSARLTTGGAAVISATNKLDLFSGNGGLSVALTAGIAGAVSVVVVRSDTSAYTTSGTILTTTGTGDVIIGAAELMDIDVVAVSGTATAGIGLAASVSVVSLGNDLTTEQSGQLSNGSDNSLTLADNASSSSWTSGVLGGFSSTGDADNVDGTDTPSAASRISSAAAGAKTNVDSNAGANAATGGLNTPPVTTKGTDAFIAGTVNAGGNVDVRANERIDLDTIAGAVAIGLGGAGAGVTVANVNRAATASIDVTGRVKAGLNGAGSVDVMADMRVNADATSAVGAGGLIGALGASVTIHDDFAGAKAEIDGHVTDADSVNVKAFSERDVDLSSTEATVGAVAGGASVTEASIGGTTEARTGSMAIIGTGTSGGVGTFLLEADSEINAKVEGTSISAGIGSGGVNSMKVVVTGTVRADVNGSTINTSGSATVRADSDVYSNVIVGSIKAAGIALGKSVGRSTVTTDVTAQVRGSADLNVGALTVTADAIHEADATATSSAGAAISVTGVESFATVGGTVTASLGGIGMTVDAGIVTVEAIAMIDADAKAKGISGGALSVGGALAEANVSTTLAALIGSGRVTASGNVDVYARHNAERTGSARADAGGDLGLGASATSQASSGGLIAGGKTTAKAFDSSSVSAKIDGGAVSGNNVTITSVSVGRADADATSVVGGLAAKGTSFAGATMGGSNLAAVQSADITSRGTLNINSIDSVRSEGTAKAGGGGLLAGVGAEAVAVTIRSAQALVTGNSSDIISANSVRVLAQSKMQSNAVSSGVSIGGVALGDSKSTATTTATVNAMISGATVTATVGNVDVDALFNTTGSSTTGDAARAHATTSTGGIGAASNSNVNATSTVNISAGFGDNSTIMAADDIDALARAFNKADSSANNNATGLISGGKAEATSNAITNARGILGTGASLTAADIAQIKALAIGELQIDAIGGSAGLVAGSFSKGMGAINTSANTETGTSSTISARDARLLAETMAKAVVDVTGNSGQELTDTLVALFTGDFANLSIPSITASGGSVSKITGGSDSNVILGTNSRIDATNDVKLSAQNTLSLDIDVSMTVGGALLSAGAAYAYTHIAAFDADVILKSGASVFAERNVDVDATNIISGHQTATGNSNVTIAGSNATGLSEVTIGASNNLAEARLLMQGSSRIEAAALIDIDVTGYATDFNGATSGDALVVTGKANADAAIGATANAIGIGKAYGKSIVDMADDAVWVTRSVDIDGASDLKVDEVANADASSPIVEFVETIVNVVKKVTKWLPWPLDKIVEWVTEAVLKIVRVVTFLEENADVVSVGDTADDVVDLRGSIYLGDGQQKLLHVLADGTISADSNVGATITGNTILVDDIINDAGGKLDIRLVRGVVSGDADIYLPKLLTRVDLINDTARDLHVQRVDMISDNGGEPDINIIDSRPAPADIVPGFNIKNAGGDYTQFNIRNNSANTGSDVLFLNDIANVAAIYDFYVAGGNIDQASGVDLIAGDAGEMFATMKFGVLVPAVTVITDQGSIGSATKNFEVELVRGRDFANGDISHTPITMVAHAGNDVNLTVQGTNITFLLSTPTTQVADDIRLDLSAGNDVNFTGNAGKLTTILTTDIGGGNYRTVATDYTVEAAYQILNASSSNGDVRLLANGMSSMAIASVTAQNGLARIEAGGNLSDLTGTTVKNITAKDVTLISRSGSIGSVGNALDIDSSNASVGLVNATALNGAITLNETSGDMRIGTIRAGGAVTLSGDASLIDGASDAAADVIGSVVTLRATSGTIGTASDRLELDTARLDVATARAVYLTEVSGDFVTGDVDATAGHAVLHAAAGNLRVDSVTASGNATLLSDIGAVLDDTGSVAAAVRADSITINAATTIGTSTNAFEIDSAFSGAGQVNATAGQGIWLTETANAMTIASIVSGNGPIVLNGPADLVLLADGLIQATAGTVTMTATGAIRTGTDSEIRASGAISFTAASLTTGAGSLVQGGQIAAGIGGNVATGANSMMASTGSISINAGGAIATGVLSLMTAATTATLSSASVSTGADSAIQGQGVSITTTGAMTTGTDSVIAATNGASLNIGSTLTTGASSSITAGGALNVQAATLIHGIGALMSAASVTANVSGSVTMLQNAQIRATGNAAINAGANMTMEDGAIVEALNVDLSAGDVATFKTGSTVRAGEALTISSDDVLLQNAGTLFAAGTSMVIAIDLADRDAAGGTMVLQGALSAPSILMIGGQEDDTFTVNVQSIDGNTLLLGGAGDDTVFIDRLPSMTTVRDGLRDSFTIDGQAGSDDVRIDLTGTSDVLIRVSDSGNPGDGIDTMSINTTSDKDTVLVRANFIALLQDDGAGGYDAALERINYDQSINARVRIDTGLGDDLIVLDDNSAMMTIDAGKGNDTFQVGQIFGTSRTDPNVAPGDEIDTVLTTLGLLSRGISQATVLYGGVGNDTFRVYSNHAELRMEGEDGNDVFLMRAFLLQDSTEISLVGQTQLNAGAGDDEVRYNINAPVDIDGGAGFDRVIAVGSEGDDVFLVTKKGVFGAGLSISLSGVEESLEVDGLEGDDTFYIQSTNIDAITTIIGGLGSDTFNVGGSVLKPIISASSGGQSGIINHIANADPITDGGYATLLAQGVNILVKPVDPTTPVVITTSGSDTSVREGDGLFDTYTLRMPALPADEMSRAWITVSGALPSSSQSVGARGVLVSLDGTTWSEQLVVAFDAVNWNAERTIFVKAADDTAEEGGTTAIISHSIISTDADLNGARIGNVSVAVGDDDAAAIVITQTNGGTRAIEGGTDDTVGVTLSRALEAGEIVTVTLGADAGAGLSANTLTFTEANWNIAQIVTVSALDDTIQTGNQSVTIGATSTSTGSFDASLTEITAELVDDETASVIVTETDGTTVVGDSQTDSYTLQLSSQPIGTVTVALQNDGQTVLTSGDARFAGNTVTFDATNWDQPITINVAMVADLVPVDPANPTLTVAASPHRVDAVQGPLLLTGGVGPENRSIVAAVILPTEFDIAPTQPTPSTDDTGDVDRVNVFSDGTSEQTIGTLTSNNISGLGMGGSLTIDQGEDGIENLVSYAGGITYEGMDIVEVMLGRGDDIFTVESTAEGTITAIHGGGGDDRLTALDHTGPLVIYGDTSATGLRYSSSIDGVSENAFAFPMDGNDLIDISATSTTVVVDAGGGNDTILGGAGGDHIAAGGGDDTVVAGLGVDHIYGDGRFEVDLVARVTTTHDGVIGNDDLRGGDGDDVIFGDNGRILQPGLLKVLGTTGATFITTTSPGVGGSDTIDGENGSDIILGGAAGDTIRSGTGVDVVFGDFGEVIVSSGFLVQARSIDADKTTGGSDTITGGTEGDFIVGGAANDMIDGEQGSDVIFGDHGALTWASGLLTLAISTDVDETTGGADTITGGSEGDIIVGGSAGDLISGNGGADLLFGDHAEIILAGGLLVSAQTRSMERGDGGADTIDGGDGDDVIMGGEAGDTIVGGEGNDAIIGDGGQVEYEAGGQVIKLFRTTTEGLGGDDTIRSGNGDDFVLAGFGADDVNAGEGGDLILGDNGLIVLSGGRLLTVETTATTLGGIDQIAAGNGNDTVLGGTAGDIIDAGDGDDLVFGDFGKLLFVGGALARATSTNTDEGGADTITLGAGNDIALGGADSDTITGGLGMDIILGDSGIVIRDADGDVTSLDAVHTIAPLDGGDDDIDSGDGNDAVFGGSGADNIVTGAGNDLAFGDHGGLERLVDGAIDLSQLPLTTAAALPFSFTSRDIGVDDGGAGDRITMGLGDDIAVGGQGGDWISGGDGQDDLIGGHTICEGADGDDAIDAGAGDDVVAGDNAEILRRNDTLDQRARTLLGDTLYTIDPQTGYFTAGYVANVDATWQDNPNGSQGRDIRLLDHSENADPSTWGDDLIAGGADADRLFGQRGKDTILGDGSIDFDALGGPIMVEAGAITDSDDYIEGGGGSDTLIGGLGQDDLIGGSSMLFLGESCGDPTGERLIDDADTIFGGTSLDITRNSFGVEGDGQYARDADVILGDNGTIYRIVTDGASLNYEWDITGTETTERVEVRAVEYLAYTPGGAASDIGGGDTIHGEAGNDIIHGQSGDDLIYGGAQDDDIIGGAGNDWISGGTGNDGILGDDGKILTSRNGWTEQLIGLTVARVEQIVSTNASAFHAILNPLGDLNKTVDLEPWDLGGEDLIYGGLGDDFVHGGAGNDGISGAEALAQFYTQPSDWRPTVDPATGRLVVPDGYFDKTNALTRIEGFVLNFDPTEGELAPMSREWAKGDGDDKLFGDIGHDWLMGGTGRDHMWGGLGGDILNLDDDLSTSGADAKTTPISGYGDLAYGGGGRDLMIANTSHDRMVDWAGEYNEFVVPFAPNGAWTIVRAPAPWIIEHLLAVAESDGADPTRSAFGDSDQMGEPYGEIGLADQDSGLWQDNTGKPYGKQSGNIGGGQRDGRGIEPAPQATDPASLNFISEPYSNVETMSFDAMTLASEPEGGEGWITEEAATPPLREVEDDMPAPDAVIVVSAPANDDSDPDALDLEANGTTGHNVDWDWASATIPVSEVEANPTKSKAPIWAGRWGKAKGTK